MGEYDINTGSASSFSIDESNDCQRIFAEQPQCGANSTNRDCKKSKKVTFDTTVIIRKVPHVDDVCSATKNDLWISRDELQRIKKECKSIMESLRKQRNGTEGIGRGLEHFLSDPTRSRRYQRNELYRVILGIQDFESQLVCSSSQGQRIVEDLISQRSSAFSSKARMEARERGIQDAQIAKEER